jgi:hypothetical protein
LNCSFICFLVPTPSVLLYTFSPFNSFIHCLLYVLFHFPFIVSLSSSCLYFWFSVLPLISFLSLFLLFITFSPFLFFDFFSSPPNFSLLFFHFNVTTSFAPSFMIFHLLCPLFLPLSTRRPSNKITSMWLVACELLSKASSLSYISLCYQYTTWVNNQHSTAEPLFQS